MGKYANRLRGIVKRLPALLGQPVLATIIGLAVGSVVIAATGNNPLYVYQQMFEKSFFNLYYLLQTLTRAVPITVCAIAVVVSWRAGYINLGVEGQMITGSLVATAIAVYLPGPPALVLAVAVVGGAAAGALVSLFSAYIYHKFQVSIVISTLMVNYIASYVSSYFVSFPLKDPASGLAIQTNEIPAGMRLPRIFEGNTFNIGFFITIAIVLFSMFLIYKTSFGYESKMTGLNPVFARYGGVKQTSVMIKTMALSGAIAALAGMLEIFGVKYRFIDNMFGSTSYAWTGLMSALISSLHPLGSLVVSIFLSGLQVGGQAIQRTTNIPLQVATLIQTTITLFVSVKLLAPHLKKKLAKNNTKANPNTPPNAAGAKEGDAT